MTFVVLDLPVPPSVNQTRRVDWATRNKFSGWNDTADRLLIAARSYRPTAGPVQITITMSEKHTRIDLDNGLKWLLDYLRRIAAIEDDNPKILRKITVEWGEAPEGCRVVVRPA